MITQPLSRLKLIFLALLIVLLFFLKKPQKSPISPINPTSSPIVIQSPSPSPTSSTTPSPSLKPSSKPNPSPTPVPSPQLEYSQEEIHSFFEKYSNDYHVDINILRSIAICESSFNSNATNLYYSGLFQFSPNTWAFYRNLINADPNPDLRINAKEAVKTAAYVLSINHTKIWPNCMPE